MSSFFEMVQNRESCRNYAEIPVEKEKLLQCVEAARLAPSACNAQPWHFTVVSDPLQTKKLADCLQDLGMNQFTDRCPAFIVINEERANLSATVGGRFKSQEFASVDIGIAAAQICYAALDQGLSTCILGWFHEGKLKKLLEISDTKRIRLVIAVGYAADASLRPKKRKALEEIATFL